MSVRTSRVDGVWTAVLDRPSAANAFSADLVESLHHTLDEAERAGAEALVLRGNPRHFAAGFDLGDLHEESDASLAHRFLRIGLFLERLLTAPFLTAAIVEGAAIGAGADLVAACDLRIGLPGATFRFPGARFGVVLGTARLSSIVGPAAAQRLVAGRTVVAEGALLAGLLTDLVDDAARADIALTDALSAWRATEPGARPALLHATRRVPGRDEELAALARSVLRPGLRDRVAAYAGRTPVTAKELS